MAVGGAYILARDQVVGRKGGSQLWSPALSFTSQDLDQELANKQTPSGEGVESVTKVTEAEQRNTEGVSDAESALNSGSDTFDQLTVSGSTYHVGDVVYLTARYVANEVRLLSCDCHVTTEVLVRSLILF